ncbi:MAG: LysM peptidoglycan-binding domain-containing protein [Hyphomonadaceae bacterium]|nr:LysM peptidoglycan-binding domain-containing protein [Clostridia bacterium]
MKDDLDMYDDLDDENEDQVKISKRRRLRSGADVRDGDEIKSTALSISVVVLAIIVVVLLFFQLQLQGKFKQMDMKLAVSDETEEGETAAVRMQGIEERLDVLEGKPVQAVLTSPTTSPASSAKPAAAAALNTAQPQASAKPSSTIAPTTTKTQGVSGKQYTLVDGDNLWVISKKLYGNMSKVTDIMTLNNLDEKKAASLQVGQTITVPAP